MAERPTVSRLGWRLIAVSATVWALFFLIVFGAFAVHQYYSLRDDMSDRLQSIAGSTAVPAAAVLYSLDTQGMEAIARGALDHREVGRFTIRDDAFPKEAVTAERPGLVRAPLFSLPPEVVRLNPRLGYGSGTLEVVNDPAYFRITYLDTLRTFLLSGFLASALLVAVLVVILNRLVIVPVTQLSRAAAAVDPDQPCPADCLALPRRPPGELGTLTETLRAMILRLARYADDLEAQVAERTTELRREVEERKEAERRAIDSDQRLRYVLRTSSDGIVTLDAALRVTDLNDAFAAYVDATPAALQGACVGTLLGDEVEELLAATDTEPSFVREVTVDRPGHLLQLLVTFTRGCDDAGTTTGWFLVAVDISDLKAVQHELQVARDEAEAANRAKSTFLANMSHEIRTPLNGILGFAELLLHHPRERLTSGQAERVDRIIESGRGLLAIINDILDLSKIEADRVELERIPVALEPLVCEVGAMVLPAARDKGLKVLTYVDPDMPQRVMGDPVRLRQILLNLAGNAVKFTEDGQVVIRVMAEAGQLIVEVEDTGIGIALEKQENIFDAFCQADGSTTRQFGGTGLGLAISKRLALLMGGTITLESAPGRGSLFRVILPLAAADDGPEACPSGRGRSRSRLANTGVVIDIDDLDLLGIVCRYLTAAGAEVTHLAGRGVAAALAASRSHRTVMLLGPDWSGDAAVMLAHSLASVAEGSCPVVHLSADGGAPAIVGDGRVVEARAWAASRTDIVAAVAVAAGEASPATFKTVSAPPMIQRAPLSVAEAQALGRLVLVADDSAINRDVIAQQVNLLGEACVVAETGLDALEVLNRHSVALVLTDVHMPEMDGLDLTRAIRARGLVLPVVALTANAMKGQRERCLGAGMTGFLSKPLSLEDLDRALTRWLPPRSGEAPATARPVATDDGFAPLRAAGVDPSVLRDSIGDDPVLADRFLRRFLGMVDGMTGALHTAAPGAPLRQAAHKLKSSALTVGAGRIAEAARRIEHAAGITTNGIAPEDVETLDLAVAALRHHLDRPTPPAPAVPTAPAPTAMAASR